MGFFFFFPLSKTSLVTSIKVYAKTKKYMVTSKKYMLRVTAIQKALTKSFQDDFFFARVLIICKEKLISM